MSVAGDSSSNSRPLQELLTEQPGMVVELQNLEGEDGARQRAVRHDVREEVELAVGAERARWGRGGQPARLGERDIAVRAVVHEVQMSRQAPEVAARGDADQAVAETRREVGDDRVDPLGLWLKK